MTAPAAWEPVRPHLSSFDPTAFVRPVGRFAWVPVPADSPVRPAGASPLAGRHLLVLGAVSDVVAAVAAELRTRGAIVDAADPAVPLPTGVGWDGIVDLQLTGRTHQLGDDAWRGALARTTEALQLVYRDWAVETSTHRHGYLVVTHLGGLMGHGPGPVPQALGGIWAGLAKCLPRELPTVDVAVVDVDSIEAGVVAEVIECEYGRSDAFEIGYRDGRRYVLAGRPAPDPEPRLDLGPGDVVLITGGARGVGFAAARGFAEEFGCRVVVTGRGDEPSAGGVSTLDDAEFAAWRRQRLAGAVDARSLAVLRREVGRAGEARTVHRNLAEARAAGLRLEYLRCDCTDAAAVEAAFAALGDGPTVVVHNAGIDEPVRFDRKTVASVLDTVAVKVDGFTNLVAAVLARPERRARLRILCNVGSLAGRMGGMVGQIDYAAGNEALARLGLWARTDLGLPTQTLCWPTWERLGVIANYSAAVRYVSTLDPAEGVRRWVAELRAGHCDEVVFLGRVGAVLAPAQLRGYGLLTGHPDLPRLHALAHHLGEVDEYALFQLLRTRHRLVAGEHPVLGEVTLDGRAALPASVLVELAVAAGDWVVPEGWPMLHLRDLRDLELRLDELAFPADGVLQLGREAVGSMVAGEWQVRVTVRRDNGATLASVTLGYGAEPPELPELPNAAAGSLSVASGGPGRLAWAGIVFPDAGAATPADLWTVPFPPLPTVAPHAIERMVSAAVSTWRAGGGVLRIDRLVLRPGAQQAAELVPVGARSWLGRRAGQPVLWADGVEFLPAGAGARSPAPARRPAVAG